MPSKSNLFEINYSLIEYKGNHYFVPDYAKHRPACQAILKGGYYEPKTHELIGLLLGQRRGNLIHAGTFFGDMLPSFSSKCPETVYAFEPVLENYILAKLCLERNNIKNVALFNSGLGESTSIAYVDTVDDKNVHRGGGSSIADKGQVTTIVAIDSLLVDNISVIQLDVEGFELAALKGARFTIKNCNPTILIEDNNNNCSAFLKALDYVLAGRIPGLSVWAYQNQIGAVHHLLNMVDGSI